MPRSFGFQKNRAFLKKARGIKTWNQGRAIEIHEPVLLDPGRQNLPLQIRGPEPGKNGTEK